MQITIKEHEQYGHSFHIVEDKAEKRAALNAGIAVRSQGYVVIYGELVGLMVDGMLDVDKAEAFVNGFAKPEPEPTKPLPRFCHYCGHPVSNDHGFFGEPVCDNCR